MNNNYILVPHFYRLNWAKEMSEFLRSSSEFEYLDKRIEYGNYSKAEKLREEYLSYLLEDAKIKGRTLFFVNLNDYIYFSRRQELKDKFKIVGFMRGSRYFDGEPGNASFGKNLLANMHLLESEALIEIDCLYVGSKSFESFLIEKVPKLNTKIIKVVGIPIFQVPCYLGKKISEINEIKKQKIKGLILWNHRLQKQKNPWALFELEDFVKRNVSVCAPEALSAAYSKEMKQHESIFNNIVRDNGKKRQIYLSELKRAEFVLSTSDHETWGNSMIEGIMNGAVPFAPDGELCSYRELFPAEFLYPQNLIKKEKDIATRSDNMIQLSYLLDDFTKADHSKQLLELQKSLWYKYKKDEWLKRLF